MKMPRTTTLLIGLSLTLGSSTMAQWRPTILNPETHASPSAEYALFVNPTDLCGGGPADYRFMRNGEIVWTNRFPFTLWEAVVANSGYVAGYAYSYGPGGFSDKGYAAGRGDFTVVILSPKGELLAKDVHRRESSQYIDDESANPLAQGVLVSEPANRAVIRIADPDLNQGTEQWWSYDLKSGKRLDTLAPQTQMPTNKARLSIVAARALPSTPLVLIHWWMADYPRVGAVFTLVDVSGKPVWTLPLDDDYSVPSDNAREDEVQKLVKEHGGILAARTNGTFDLHFVKEALRVSFAVEPQPSGRWNVMRTGQSPYTWPRPAPEPAPVRPKVSLRRLGETKLAGGDAGEPSQIRDLRSFDFASEGAICALRARLDTPPCLLYLSQKGDVMKELQVPVDNKPTPTQFSNPASVGGRKFVIAVSDQEIDGKAQWFLADFDAGTVEPMTNAMSPCVQAVAGFPDGSFVAVTARRSRYSSSEGIFLFDATGTVTWNREQNGHSGEPEDLLHPEDVTRSGTNEFAVLDVVRDTIQVFDRKGNFERFLDLTKAWGRKPSYPTDLAPDENGGFIVYDFDAKQTLVRLDPTGKIRFESSPRFADGRPFCIHDGVKLSPQGDLWTCDGDSLLRLTTNGVVDLILGDKPTPSILRDPDQAYVGPDDRVYVSDRRAKCVHVFDALGKHLGQCVPDPQDLTPLSDVGHVAVSRDGSAYLSLVSCNRGFLRFNDDLSRSGWSKVDVNSSSQDWYFQPTNDLCWIVGENHVYLVKNLHEIARRISRRADGQWLEYPRTAAVASDGSLAVAANSQSGAHSVSTFSPAGDARSTFELPGSDYVARLAYDGQRVYVRRGKDMLLYSANGDLLGSFAFESDDARQHWIGPFLAAKGRELWFISTADLTIHRYAAPNKP